MAESFKNLIDRGMISFKKRNYLKKLEDEMFKYRDKRFEKPVSIDKSCIVINYKKEKS